GVHAAHQAGVIHRDLKPENILLSESDGQIVPKVVDFGVSKNVGASAMPNSSLTRTGALVGTPHYMALEQVDGSNAIDSRTDVYAFGVLLYRALTGHFPFDGSSLGEVILKIGTKEAPPMRTLRPELPLALDTLVLRALSRDRNKRFGDLEELARGLSQFANWRTGSESLDPSMTPGAMAFRPFGAASAESVSGGQTPSSARATPPIGPGSQKRRRTLLIAGVAALSMLVTGAYLTFRDSAEAPLATPLPAAAKPTDKSVGAVRSATLPSAARAVPALGALAQQPGVVATGVLPTSILDGKDGPEQLEAATAVEPAASEGPAAEPARTREAAPSPRVEKSRSNPERSNAKRTDARTPSAGRKSQSHGSGVVPGERTNGFSVDEF
ncbi:MAG: Adenylate cyclase, partial [Myxococcaceae bacterium]|nr:Adenylate cyclase [Myxococcaceae bacterium]